LSYRSYWSYTKYMPALHGIFRDVNRKSLIDYRESQKKNPNKRYTMNYSRLGFTMIELLVAISIMAILTGIGAYSFNNAQVKARDNHKKQELAQIKAALELYYQENGSYPPTPAGCPTIKVNTIDYAFCSAVADKANTNWIPGLIKYMPKVPNGLSLLPTPDELAGLFQKVSPEISQQAINVASANSSTQILSIGSIFQTIAQNISGKISSISRQLAKSSQGLSLTDGTLRRDLGQSKNSKSKLLSQTRTIGGQVLGAATQGPRNPTTSSIAAGAFCSNPCNNTWQFTNYVFAQDAWEAYSQQSISTGSLTLIADSYGFTIPANATISGISMTLYRNAGLANAIVDKDIILLKGGSTLSANKADFFTYWPNFIQARVYGSSADLWGLTWTPADINSNFWTGVACKQVASATGSVCDVDTIQITVYYNIPDPPTVTTGAAASVTASSAVLNGTVNPNGSATTGWFRYSTTNPGTCNNSFGTSTSAVSLGSGTSGVALTTTAYLSPSTTYYYCAIANNALGTTWGSPVAFATLSAPTCSGPSSTTINTAVTYTAGGGNGVYSWNTSTGVTGSGSSFTTSFPYPGNHWIYVSSNGASTYCTGPTVTATWFAMWYSTPAPPTTMITGSVNAATINVYNAGNYTWVPGTGTPTSFGYHWWNGACPAASGTPTGTNYMFGNNRTATGTVAPGAYTGTINISGGGITAPATAGTYCLVYDMVQDGVTWFNWQNSYTKNTTVTVIVPPAPTNVVANALPPGYVTDTTALLNGSANPNGGATTGWFRYWTSNPGTCTDTGGTRIPTSTSVSLGSGTSPVAYPPIDWSIYAIVSPNANYWYCAIANNPAGTSFSSIVPFTTTTGMPTNLLPGGTINAGLQNITWTAPAGATPAFYYLRVNDKSDASGTTYAPPGPCDNNTTTQITGDICQNPAGTSYSYNFQAGHIYDVWVHSANAGGYYSNAIVQYNVTAIMPPPTNLQPNGTTAYGVTAFTWTGVSVPSATYTISVDDTIDGWSNPACLSSSPPTTGDLCYNNGTATSYTYTFTAGHTYNWNVKACVGATCSTATSATVTITIPAIPTAQISASPSAISKGETSQLVWSSTGGNCTGTSSPSGWSTGSPSGSTTMSPTANTTYSLDCVNALNQHATSSVTVTVSNIPANNPCQYVLGYCYIAIPNASGKYTSFFLWAQLENKADKELYNRNSADCTGDSPKPSTFNYCMKNN
jgi:prepilin-type N-terminal cleavage/methylation domain-containing protein